MNHRHTDHITGFTRIEFVIVVAIVGGLLALLYPVIQRTRNPKGPHGETYPTTAPVESNRVSHPTGVSIIAPENWDQLPDSLHLRIAARGMPGRRLKSVIAIWQCAPEPSQQVLSLCQEIQFQQDPAYERCQVLRENSFDDPASSSYDLYVKRNGVWWQINFLVDDKMTMLPNSIRQYIETIEFPKRE